MIKIITAAITLTLASCAGIPITVGWASGPVQGEYSSKGGLILVVEPSGK